MVIVTDMFNYEDNKPKNVFKAFFKTDTMLKTLTNKNFDIISKIKLFNLFGNIKCIINVLIKST